MNQKTELKQWKPNWPLFGLVALLFFALPLASVLGSSLTDSKLEKNKYELWSWEIKHLPNALISNIGKSNSSIHENRKAVVEYFRLTSLLRTEMAKPLPEELILKNLGDEREKIEDSVEIFLQVLIHNAVKEADLTTQFPLLKNTSFVWPPVAIELETPPLVLVRSDRNKITRKGDTLLKPGLSEETIISIENETDSDETASLVVQIGGLATYPSSVLNLRTYSTILEIAAHEWIHHYLAFHPLGQKYWDSQRFREINETTANIAGRAIADLIQRKNPLTFPKNMDGRASVEKERVTSINVSDEFRNLRAKVDELLNKGQISEAESLMLKTQDFLNANGFNIRKINQAYFAFYGTYTDLPQSSSPIGPKIKEIWELTGRNIRVFLTTMRTISSVNDLDEILATFREK